MPLDKDNIFRSEAYLAAQEARAALKQAELEAEAAQAVVLEHQAKIAELEEIEAERQYGLHEKTMRSRVQAARNRVSTLTTIAAELELNLAAVGATYAKLTDEIAALDAVLPDTVARPFPREVLDELFEIELFRNALPVAHYRTIGELFSETVETLGKSAVAEMSVALGIRPHKALTEAEEQPA